jgi:2-dehydropantoate 2-reductase
MPALIETVPSPRKPRVLIVGAGGIGAVVAASIYDHVRALHGDVTALTTNAAIASVIDAHGFRVSGFGGTRTVRCPCVTELPTDCVPFDFVLLATQPPQVETAAKSVAHVLSDTGAMVCLQNGLCEERIAKIVGDQRVMGAVVAWGATMPDVGVYERTAGGGFAIGTMDNHNDPRLATLATILEPIGTITHTHNLRGARWSKLAINCAISALGTIAGERLGTLMTSLTARRIALRIMTEVVHVARAEKVSLEKVSGTLDLDWIALTDSEIRSWGTASLLAKHTMLLAVGAKYRRMRSSMLSAIERGRPPAVDFLNGEVVTRGEKHGIATPVNAEAQRIVHAIARGEMTSSRDTMRTLAQRVGIAV